MQNVKPSAFLIWWNQLNKAMDKIKPGQQVLFGDARDYYRAGYGPETAAQMLWIDWEGVAPLPYGKWEH